jgi:aryl-alcohol dehydrogenase-like predicted oxidoreductase
MKTESNLHSLPTKERATLRSRRAWSRREFIGSLAGASFVVGSSRCRAVGESDQAIPKRVLGRTGVQVTVLGLGTAPIGEGPIQTDEAARIFGEVMDRGVNYIDTAFIYGNAEEALGQLVPSRRDRLFLVTKVWTDNAKRAEEMLHTSLKRLGTDYVDLCHIHHIGGKDLAKVQAEDGVYPYLLKQKEAGKIRFIGMSGHCRPPRFVEMLETGGIDVVMPVLNYADVHTYGFERIVLPKCREQNVGVVAMKVYAGIKGGFPNHRRGHVGCVTPHERLPQAMAFALDLEGVSSAVIGPYTLEQAIENVEFARRYRPLNTAQREGLLAFGRELAPQLGTRYGPAA